jgi:hypothetical protein
VPRIHCQDLRVTPEKKRPTPEPDAVTPLVTSLSKRLCRKTTVQAVFTPEVKQKLQDAIALYGLAHQGNPEGQDFHRLGACDACTICKVARHRVKWVTRLTGKGLVKTTGSQCYCCNRASLLLGCTRSLLILRSVPEALEVLKVKSLQLRHEMRRQGSDVCTCVGCRPVTNTEQD